MPAFWTAIIRVEKDGEDIVESWIQKPDCVLHNDAQLLEDDLLRGVDDLIPSSEIKVLVRPF